MRNVLLIIFVLLFPAISYSQPSIEFDAETKDFGRVTAGERIEHVFEIRNTGDEELSIEKLVPS